MAKAQDRAFEVASYRYDAIFRPLDQLLVPKETARRPKPPPGQGPARPRSFLARPGAVISGTSAGFGRRFAALIYDARAARRRCSWFTRRRSWSPAAGAVTEETAGGWWYAYRAGELIAHRRPTTCSTGCAAARRSGMRAWRLRAVSAIGRDRSSSRPPYCALLCAVAAWAPAALGVLWLYFDPEHLALHDRLSSTACAAPSAFLRSRRACTGRSRRSAASRPAPGSTRTAARRSRSCA